MSIPDNKNRPAIPDWLSRDNQFRYNPLTGDMIQVSTERLLRAWGGEVSKPPDTTVPTYERECPFCPGNVRAHGDISPLDINAYPYAFTNDTSALRPEPEVAPHTCREYSSRIFRAARAFGECEVIIHHPSHNLTLAAMPQEHTVKVFQLWADRYEALGKKSYINYVNIFENFLFGSSQRHPHNQLWASSIISPVQKTILQNLDAYQKEFQEPMVETIAREELLRKERLVYENSDFVVIVPFWAEWPFEMMILPRRAKNSLLELTETELENFTDAYRNVITKLNTLFKGDCPYSSGLYQTPTDGNPHNEGMFYCMFRPPVLRNIQTLKWMVGYELMALLQRDLTPEAAAFLLRTPDGWEEFKNRYIKKSNLIKESC